MTGAGVEMSESGGKDNGEEDVWGIFFGEAGISGCLAGSNSNCKAGLSLDPRQR